MMFKRLLWRIRLWQYERSLLKLYKEGLIDFSADCEGATITPKGKAWVNADRSNR